MKSNLFKLSATVASNATQNLTFMEKPSMSGTVCDA